MFECDHHHQGAYCVSLLKLQCWNIWLKYIIVVHLAVWLHMLPHPCWCVSCTLRAYSHTAKLTKIIIIIISFMELGHLLTRSGLTYPELSSKVYHDSFCQMDSSISLPWVIYFDTFYLHVVSSFSCIPVICPKLVLFLTPLINQNDVF